MPTVPVLNVKGDKVGDEDLSERVFGAKWNEPLVHQVVTMQQTNRRVGTAKTKTRSEVSGGGRKPWRQKGTGRARHGSTRSPIWRHGGTTFGPIPRNFELRIPKRARRAALRSLLSERVRRGDFVILDELTLPEAKTKLVAQILKDLEAGPTTLVVTEGRNSDVERSARNIPGVSLAVAPGVNVLQVAAHGKLLITRAAVRKLEEVLA